MNIGAIIAEFNPLTEGHKYLIEKAKQQCDSLIVLMSGNYVQRGTPAIFDKHSRAQDALNQGSDLLLELPLKYSTSSAENFAYGSVKILSLLNCIDKIYFGSECGDISLLTKASEYIHDIEADSEFNNLVKQELKNGYSYPNAWSNALEAIDCNLDDTNPRLLTEILKGKNNLLGIKSLTSMKTLSSAFTAETIKRIDKNSATTVRYNIHEATLGINKYDVPNSEYASKSPLFEDDFSLPLYMTLVSKSEEELSEYVDVSSDLAYGIKSKLKSFSGYNDFSFSLKNKSLSFARVQRALLHIMLDIKENNSIVSKNSLSELKESEVITDYTKVLGFNEKGREILSLIKKNSMNLAIVTKPSDFSVFSNDDVLSDYKTELQSDALYYQVLRNKYKDKLKDELTISPIILDK
ncbi:MAG: nucleotidyltransferase family protein [Lachnospiraceae bacterium]|nr:nucleotidyltransferase family protein [Lachnospiraceae bacterium]